LPLLSNITFAAAKIAIITAINAAKILLKAFIQTYTPRPTPSEYVQALSDYPQFSAAAI
jgi:hypothetical protein